MVSYSRGVFDIRYMLLYPLLRPQIDYWSRTVAVQSHDLTRSNIRALLVQILSKLC